MKRLGKLYFRYGTMGSAKTALLLTTAYNFEERGMSYLCFKPSIDTREKKNVIRSRSLILSFDFFLNVSISKC